MSVVYALLRAIAGLALRWYYRDIEVQGAERIPRRGPVLVVVNHPNALVDVLLVGRSMPRRLSFTGKAVLFSNPVGGALLRWLGVVPLVRAQDVTAVGTSANVSRNVDAFRAVVARLAEGGAVLIFPEGVSRDEPRLAPIKTGAARMAIEAVSNGVADLAILPIGLMFERKEAPRTRVVVQVGDVLAVGDFIRDADNAVERLTAEIEARLRSVTLNYDSLDDAAQATALASVLQRVLASVVPPVGRGPSLFEETAIARRVEEIRRALASADDTMRERAAAIVERARSLRAELRGAGLATQDLSISTGTREGAWFVVRELGVSLVGGPFAVWGAINHVIPLRLSRMIAGRGVESAADPAMRTIIAGVCFVLAGYVAQAALVWRFFGAWIAVAYAVSLPLCADVNFRLLDRRRRAIRRARAYLRFRRDPTWRARLLVDADRLRYEALELDALMLHRSTETASQLEK